MTNSFHGTRALRHRNYRLYFTGQLISLIGTWMQQVGEAWLVLQLTHDPLWLGIVSVAQFGPVIAFGLFGGVIADQLPKRRTLIRTQSVAMTLAFILFALSFSGVIQVWHILICAFVLGCANAIDMPSRQSFAVEMVGREDVANAVGLNSAVFNTSRIIGPAVAGIAIGVLGVPIAYLMNGISFIAVITAYAMMRDEELRPAPKVDRPTSFREVIGNLGEGLQYVRSTPILLMAITVLGLVATFGMNFSVLVPPLAEGVLGVGATGYGILMAASGVGSLVSALSVAFTSRVNPRRILIGAAALGVGSVLLSFSRVMPLSMVAMMISGAGGIGMAVTANTTMQLHVPDHLRGRVMSVYTTTFSATAPAGGLIMGAVASAFGVPMALLVGGVVSVAIAIAALPWLRRIQGQAGDATPLRRPVTQGAEIGALDPEGRSAGVVAPARPR